MSKSIFAAFVFGTAVGAAAAWYYAKTRYEQIANEEIASVKEMYAAKYADKSEKEEYPKNGRVRHDIFVDQAEKDKGMSVAEYAKKLSEEGYTNYSNAEEVPEEKAPYKPPYVIPPEDYGETGYDTISFTYYADKVLADDGDQVVEDVEGTVGVDSLSRFGEYEDDSVFVRNERLKVDYEILLSQREYAEVVESKPYLSQEV